MGVLLFRGTRVAFHACGLQGRPKLGPPSLRGCLQFQGLPVGGAPPSQPKARHPPPAPPPPASQATLGSGMRLGTSRGLRTARLDPFMGTNRGSGIAPRQECRPLREGWPDLSRAASARSDTGCPAWGPRSFGQSVSWSGHWGRVHTV